MVLRPVDFVAQVRAAARATPLAPIRAVMDGIPRYGADDPTNLFSTHHYMKWSMSRADGVPGDFRSPNYPRGDLQNKIPIWHEDFVAIYFEHGDEFTVTTALWFAEQLTRVVREAAAGHNVPAEIVATVDDFVVHSYTGKALVFARDHAPGITKEVIAGLITATIIAAVTQCSARTETPPDRTAAADLCAAAIQATHGGARGRAVIYGEGGVACELGTRFNKPWQPPRMLPPIAEDEIVEGVFSGTSRGFHLVDGTKIRVRRDNLDGLPTIAGPMYRLQGRWRQTLAGREFQFDQFEII